MNVKLLLLFSFLFIFTTSSYGQATKRDEGVKVGFKMGLNVSNFMGDDISEKDVRTSIHFGFLTEFIINDKVSFQPELLYSGQGFVGPDTKQKFNYLQLPLMIKYQALDGFTIEAGPQVGALLKAYSRGADGNQKIADQSFVDFGVNLGAGYEFQNGIFLQSRYNLGLLNINQSDNSDTFRYANSVFQVSVGVLF